MHDSDDKHRARAPARSPTQFRSLVGTMHILPSSHVMAHPAPAHACVIIAAPARDSIISRRYQRSLKGSTPSPPVIILVRGTLAHRAST